MGQGGGGGDAAAELSDWELLPGREGRLQQGDGRWLLMHAGGQSVEWDRRAKAKQEGVWGGQGRDRMIPWDLCGPLAEVLICVCMGA